MVYVPPVPSQTEVTGASIRTAEPTPPPTSPSSPDRSAEVPASEPLSANHLESVTRLAEVRCEREFACGNIGGSREYTTYDDCMTSELDAVRDDFRSTACPQGIDPLALRACVSAIRNEACSDHLEAHAYSPACTSQVLCNR